MTNLHTSQAAKWLRLFSSVKGLNDFLGKATYLLIYLYQHDNDHAKKDNPGRATALSISSSTEST